MNPLLQKLHEDAMQVEQYWKRVLQTLQILPEEFDEGKIIESITEVEPKVQFDTQILFSKENGVEQKRHICSFKQVIQLLEQFLQLVPLRYWPELQRLTQ